ncbi:hypothetical protein [Glutamicibacter ardleyensis]|uniref:hypothetical protein n=1 Tax=Glutamicibacter ardleyensis TaxID=225894 RepID=UPI003FD4FF60
MLGHEAITTLLHQSVANRLRPFMEYMIREGGIPAGELRVPAVDNIYPSVVDAVALNAFPAVMIEEIETGPRSSTRQISSDGFFDEYEIRYQFRVWLYVTGANYTATSLAQKRTATALRGALLMHRGLYEKNGESAVIDPATFRESFSDITGNDGGSKFIAGSYAEFEVLVIEKLPITLDPNTLPGKLNLWVGLLDRGSEEGNPPTQVIDADAP